MFHKLLTKTILVVLKSGDGKYLNLLVKIYGFKILNFDTFKDVIKYVDGKKNLKILIDTPLNILSNSTTNRYQHLQEQTEFIKVMTYLGRKNNNTIILKYNDVVHTNIPHILVYSIDNIFNVDGDKLKVIKTREDLGDTTFSINDILKSVRKDKLKNINKSV